jgi:hypothetical protein
MPCSEWDVYLSDVKTIGGLLEGGFDVWGASI